MPRLYYHHVAQKGLEHLAQTVYERIDASVLARTLTPDVYERIADDVQRSFPSGTFNCWGAPEPAVSVMSKLIPGDFVLLVERGGEHGEIPALCEVKVIVPGPQPDLSWPHSSLGHRG